MFRNRRGFLRASGATSLALLAAWPAVQAQPNQPIEVVRIVTGFPPAASSTPEDLANLLRTSYDRWGPIVKKIGFSAES